MPLTHRSKLAAIAVAALTLIGTVSTAFADNNQYTTGKGGRMGHMHGRMHRPMMHHQYHHRYHHRMR